MLSRVFSAQWCDVGDQGTSEDAAKAMAVKLQI